MTRVLIGEFGAIERLGIERLLVDEGCEVLAGPESELDLFNEVAAQMPDVVVTRMNGDQANVLAAIAEDFPSVKVIACSSCTPTMRVYPPFRHGESYDTPLSSPLLVEAILTNKEP